MRVSHYDLYSLRKAHLLAERKVLVAQLAQHSLKRFTLEMERKYRLLGKDGRLDMNTGLISLGTEYPDTEGER